MGETHAINDAVQATVAARGILDALGRLFHESARPERQALPQTRERLRRRALELCSAYGPGRPGVELAALGFAAESFCSIAVDLAAHPAEAAQLIAQIEATAHIPRVILGREVLRSPQLLLLPTAVAVEVQLNLLLAFAQVSAVSLWTLGAGAALKHIRNAGDFEPNCEQTIRLAQRLLAGAGPSIHHDHTVVGVTIERWQQPAAALIARGEPQGADHRTSLLEAVIPILGAILERDEMLARIGGSEQAVVTSTERQLQRLRFDLHDGPQQDVALLAQDLRFFRAQLSSIMDPGATAERLFGRLDDLTALLAALDGDLRRISVSSQSPFLRTGSLPDALGQIADTFAARTGVAPEMKLTGNLAHLTDSQQIALLALVREALSNIREHSGARAVRVTVTARPDRVYAEVTDDGQGFDPETALVSAARSGHLGLVGMHERVRLLGGHTRIDSRPGGPTIISVELPGGPLPPSPPGL